MNAHVYFSIFTSKCHSVITNKYIPIFQANIGLAGNGQRNTLLQAKGTGVALPQQQQQHQQAPGVSQGQPAQTATPLYNHKQVLQHRPGGQPVVIGQLGGGYCQL